MGVDPKDIPALLAEHGSLRKAAVALGVGRTVTQKAYQQAVAQGIMEHVKMGGKSRADQKPKTVARIEALKTKKTRHKRYILTSAQNNTLVHEGTWDNLKALAAHYDAEIFVSTFLYAGRSMWQVNRDKRKAKAGERAELWYDAKVVPYINNDRVEIASGLVWCGESNISPTAERPLSGFEVYTGRASGIFPHTHLQMQSIATVGGSGTKFNYTTGTVTLRNYIQCKAGLKAEFHHSYGALLVEVDDDGYWWVRQLCADSDGTIYDLDVRAARGKITTGHRVEGIVFGDAHVKQMDPAVKEATWGKGGMVDVLKPRFQFIHDVLDMYARNHHTIKDPYKMFKRYVQGADSVAEEVRGVADFLRWIKRKDCQTVVVPSNHDRHLGQWLAENDARHDPVNAKFWSWLNNLTMDHIELHKEEPDHLGLAITTLEPNFEEQAQCYFLPADSSFVLLPKIAGGIEMGLHFDQASNGARGSLRAFAKMGRRSSGGHSHSSGIDGGAFQSGTKSYIRLEYTHGPSSWSWSDIIHYENGKRAIITFYGPKPKWRA